MLKHKVFSTSLLKAMNLTKGELLKQMELTPETTVDFALPQEWLDSFTKISKLDYYLILGTTYYAYPEESIFGLPISGCSEVNRMLKCLYNRNIIETEEVKSSRNQFLLKAIHQRMYESKSKKQLVEMIDELVEMIDEYGTHDFFVDYLNFINKNHLNIGFFTDISVRYHTPTCKERKLNE
jgi:hypothetical protein